MAIKPTRLLLDKALPQSGEGPSKAEREAGHFTMTFIGHVDDTKTIRATVKGFKDPGYAGTAIMLGESAKCLAFDEISASGILTPSTAMAEPLLARLREAGMVFEVDA